MPGQADLHDRNWVGARVRHVEDPRYLTGRGHYTDDIPIPGALHVAFARSTHAHANIVSVDVEGVTKVPGVVAVFTAEDLEGEVDPIAADCSYSTYQQTPQEVLLSKKSRFVGEPIVAVVAEDRYAAEDGADEVRIEYEPLPAVTSVDQAMEEGATVVHEGAPDNVHVWFHRVSGDPDAAFEEADFTSRPRSTSSATSS